MRIKYFTDKAYETLLDNINQTKEKYSNAEAWVPEYFDGKEYCLDSRIESNGFAPSEEGEQNASDLVNTRIVYDALDILTPQQATNPYLWSYLSMVPYWSYTKWRWGKASPEPSEDDEASTPEEKRSVNIKQRFMCMPYRIGLLRNSISRLWWYGYLSHQPGPQSQRYELTQLLLSNSDLCQSIIERNFSMNRDICLGILKAIKSINDENPKNPVVMVEWRSLCRHLNRFGAVTVLDSMSKEEIIKMSKEYILDLRK